MKRKRKQNIETAKIKPSSAVSKILPEINPVYLLIIVTILPLITAFIYYDYAYGKNNFLSFPLDDSWIHLTFARNISEYFSFSYFKDEMVTAGSTSPLYTLILAAGFFFYKNEMILSYLLGVLFFSLSAFYFFRLSRLEFNNKIIFAFVVTCIFILDKWMNFISLSGMETIMFILFLIACAYFFKTKNAVPFAVTAGLILWIRPDGLAFIAALVITYCLEMILSRKNPEIVLFSKTQMKKISGIFILLTGLYFLFNYTLSGSLLPNTYSAKIAYFIDTEKRISFLQDKVWLYFTDGYYSIIMFGFVFSVLKFVYDLFRKFYNLNTLYVVFIFIFILIYTVKLPAINRFGRYAMPLIPFFILVSMAGYRDLFDLIIKTTGISLIGKMLYLFLIPAVFYFSFNDFEKNKTELSKHCRHIYDRQVKTAYWLKENTNENDLIATHDIGAIGFYSGRKLVDVAGLINPELNGKLNEYSYSQIMTDYCIRHNVTYLAFLSEWYTVSNQIPVFSTPENLVSEVMNVFKFNPGKTHVLSKEAHNLLTGIGKEIEKKNADKIISLSEKVITLEPDDSYAYFFRAFGYLMSRDFENYEKNIIHSIRLFPEFKPANLSYAKFLFNEKRFAEAVTYYSILKDLEPSNKNYEISLKAAADSSMNQNKNKDD